MCYVTKVILVAESIFYIWIIKVILMKKNMGKTDKIIRLLLAAIFIGLFMGKMVTGAVGVILLVLAAVLTITSVISFCPLYALLGANTCSKSDS